MNRTPQADSLSKIPPEDDPGMIKGRWDCKACQSSFLQPLQQPRPPSTLHRSSARGADASVGPRIPCSFFRRPHLKGPVSPLEILGRRGLLCPPTLFIVLQGASVSKPIDCSLLRAAAGMASEADLAVCQDAVVEAFVAFRRLAEPRDPPQGLASLLLMANPVAEGRRRALGMFRERTSNVPAAVSATFEKLLLRTLEALEKDLRSRSGTQDRAQARQERAMIHAGSALQGCLGTLIVKGSTKAVCKAGELAVLCMNNAPAISAPLQLSLIAPALAVMFVASVGIYTVGQAVENFRRAYSDDGAAEQ